MSKKLNRTEIATLAKRILEEVNEVNLVYNNTILASATFKAEVERIENQNPLKALTDEFTKRLKVEFGTKFEEHVNFNLEAAWNQGDVYKKQQEIVEELKNYKNSQLKVIYNTSIYESTKLPNGTKVNMVQKVIDDITIAQIDISDVQTLINTIKSKII